MPVSKKIVRATSSSAQPLKRAAFVEAQAVDNWSPDLLKSRAYELILLDIILGVLPPNARLDEHGMADRYQIGIAGIRDALNRLALEGMVQRRPRSGTVVAPLDIEEFHQSFSIRSLLEPEGAALAARHATEAEVDRIHRALDDTERAIPARDFPALLMMDQHFHKAVAVASHNLALARIIVSLHQKTARYWYHSMVQRPLQERVDDVAQHRTVAAAIADRDPGRARAAMQAVLGGAPPSMSLR